ncbi:MAG TPA: DinB family protein [Bacteroidia bacterium]|jgi:uncharacterized damage-inducible protein DinB|nr:DinB family protein [Bacteroidia bacterium]
MVANPDFIKEFISQSIYRIELSSERIEKSFLLLKDEDIWKRPNDASNSIGNLVLHLCGNITQYIISSLGGKPDNRLRDLEFSTQSGFTKDEVFAKLRCVIKEATEIIQNVSEEELMRVRSVQGFDITGIAIIVHVVEHYSYHTGQIAFWTKLIKDKDLGFYAGVNLNKKNQ